MKLKSRFLYSLAVLALGAAAAQAGSLDVVFDNPDQMGVPGDTLEYFGTITNTSLNTVFLNNDDVNLTGGPSDFTIDDLFANTPLSLDPGQSSGDLELFDVTIDEPFIDPIPGTYIGAYTILGGVDGNAQDVLTDPAAGFSTTVTPEPATYALILGGLAGIALLRRRRIS